MTPASATLLLITIITLNIVWGYPWLGMFAACMTLMVGGFLASRVFGPRLQIELHPPVSTPAGSSFMAKVSVRNVGRLPLFDASLRFDQKRRSTVTSNDVQSLDSVQSGELMNGLFRFSAVRRGEQAFPDALAVSTFPFALFYCHRRISVNQTLTVTPRLLDAGEDDLQSQLAAAIGTWTRRQVIGESSEYTGNREYQSGMSVRRWDHASWARLGRPIVREYSASSVSQVTLILDASCDRSSVTNEDALERLFSAAATAIMQLTAQSVEVSMVLTCENEATTVDSSRHRPTREAQSLLIRLAVARPADADQSDLIVANALAMHSGSILLLTTRSELTNQHSGHPNVEVIRVADPNTSEHRQHTDQAHSPGVRSTRSRSMEERTGVA